MNFKIGQETYSIVSCSTRDTPPRDLYIMTLVPIKVLSQDYALTYLSALNISSFVLVLL